MKMAILSMYERIGGKVGEEDVALNDTVTQLEKVRTLAEHRIRQNIKSPTTGNNQQSVFFSD